MVNILITGGAGFIGSHIVQKALELDHQVHVLDNLKTGKRSNLFENTEFIHGDIQDTDIVRDAVGKVDYIFHYAAQASVVYSTIDPIYDMQVNVGGTINLLREALNQNIKHFIFASTGGALYGNPRIIPASEDTEKKPLSPYGTSKASAEYYCEYFNRLGLPVSILRFANVYGPRQDSSGEAGVVSIFLGNIKRNKPIIVFGDGKTTRDYIFVKDIAKLNMQILTNPLNDVVNVGTGIETTLDELIQTIKNITGEKIIINREPLRAGEVKRISLASDKIKSLINWTPETSLEDGIKQVWDWIQAI